MRRLETLMRQKRWGEAAALCQADAEAIATSKISWAAGHVAHCARLSPEYQLDRLGLPAAVEARLALTMPGMALTSVRVVPEGFIALSCLVLGLRDKATGETISVFEKIYPQHRGASIQRELKLFRHIAPELLLAPRLLAHHELDQAIVVVQEYAGPNVLPVHNPWVQGHIRRKHWRARLKGRMRADIPDDGGKLLSLAALRPLVRYAAEGSAERLEALIARSPQIMAALNTIPQFPLHMDLKPTNIIMQSDRIEPDLSDIRVVDWEKWVAFPIGVGLPLRPVDLARPAQRAELARVHPLATLAATLFIANRRPPVMPAQAATLVALALDVADDVPL